VPSRQRSLQRRRSQTTDVARPSNESEQDRVRQAERAVELARLTVEGFAATAAIATKFSTHTFGDGDVHQSLAALRRAIYKLESGKLADVEGLLLGQAVALNAIFSQMMIRADRLLDVNPDLMERYMRLGLRAQGQSRATLEALAAIKHPPTVMAHLAQVSQGPQQVNNFLATIGPHPARGGDLESGQDELLEAHVESVDGCPPSSSGPGDQALAPLGTVNRTENLGREGSVKPKRLSRR